MIRIIIVVFVMALLGFRVHVTYDPSPLDIAGAAKSASSGAKAVADKADALMTQADYETNVSEDPNKK